MSVSVDVSWEDAYIAYTSDALQYLRYERVYTVDSWNSSAGVSFSFGMLFTNIDIVPIGPICVTIHTTVHRIQYPSRIGIMVIFIQDGELIGALRILSGLSTWSGV